MNAARRRSTAYQIARCWQAWRHMQRHGTFSTFVCPKCLDEMFDGLVPRLLVPPAPQFLFEAAQAAVSTHRGRK